MTATRRTGPSRRIPRALTAATAFALTVASSPARAVTPEAPPPGEASSAATVWDAPLAPSPRVSHALERARTSAALGDVAALQEALRAFAEASAPAAGASPDAARILSLVEAALIAHGAGTRELFDAASRRVEETLGKAQLQTTPHLAVPGIGYDVVRTMTTLDSLAASDVKAAVAPLLTAVSERVKASSEEEACAYARVAELFLEAGSPEAAQATAGEILAKTQRCTYAWIVSADGTLAAGALGPARHRLDAAEAAAGSRPAALGAIAWRKALLAQRAGEGEVARRQAERAIRLGSKQPEALALYMDWMGSASVQPAAAQAARDACTREGAGGSACLRVAMLEADGGDAAACRTFLAPVRADFGQAARVSSLEAECALKAGDRAGALGLADAAVEVMVAADPEPLRVRATLPLGRAAAERERDLDRYLTLATARGSVARDAEIAAAKELLAMLQAGPTASPKAAKAPATGEATEGPSEGAPPQAPSPPPGQMPPWGVYGLTAIIVLGLGALVAGARRRDD